VLVAAARYLAAHAPTVRAQGQTYQIARRLSRGERLFEDMAVRIDQAWKQRSTLGVDCRCCVRPRLSCTNYADDLTIVADEQAGEVL